MQISGADGTAGGNNRRDGKERGDNEVVMSLGCESEGRRPRLASALWPV